MRVRSRPRRAKPSSPQIVAEGRRPVGMISTLDIAGALAWSRP